jgi:hypothetical protein
VLDSDFDEEKDFDDDADMEIDDVMLTDAVGVLESDLELVKLRDGVRVTEPVVDEVLVLVEVTDAERVGDRDWEDV